ncbi:MAG: helix-turn-helix transcriptional regulator [Flavobacteriales bacterium]|nr:helix-turn-helix transcriptional regulator [Flavobacteriales bacterium]
MENGGDKATRIAFGKNLRRIRESKGMSQETLGLNAGSFQSTVLRIEHGESNPKLTTIVALAKALGVEPKELLDF